MLRDVFQLDKRKIRVAIFPSCNLNCFYCDSSAGRKKGKPGAMEDFRSKSLDHGVISANNYIKIIDALHLAGFKGMTITGGEPLLNEKWDIIIKKSKEIGMSQICLTSNGTLFESYISKKNNFPEELTLLVISLDTFDPKEFKTITSKGIMKQIITGLKMVRASNPKLKIRANKVVIRSQLKSLLNYIKLCEDIGAIDEINFLNLILKEPKDEKSKKFFIKEFVFPEEIINLLSKKGGFKFYMDSKYEYRSRTQKGLKVIIKDTNLTLRNSQCAKCPIYCQEGYYTIRVATDGAVRTCIDYKNELPFTDGISELKKGLLVKKFKDLVNKFKTVKFEKTLKKFFKKYNIRIQSQ